LDTYYSKFVDHYVVEEDQEKMRRAGTPQFLRQTLSHEQPVYDVDFRRLYPDRVEWVRARFSVAELKDGQVTKVVFANMNINEQKIKELEEEQKQKLYFEYQNIIRGLTSFYHSVFYIDLVEQTFQSYNWLKDLSARMG
ncbi:hybrid sensor histidine kinase/response regulator, partial [Intestinibacillus massiliensis]|nr:hybrid sensor histidine kinase/response regulator [Intestinibacillus massiliensis]